MRCPFATWHPTNKQGYGTDNISLRQGVVIHSAEGYRGPMLCILDDSGQKKSWHLSVFRAGDVFQHVDTNNISWASGGYEANRRFWNIECEGIAGQLLTEPQYQILLKVVRWLWETHNMAEPQRQVNFWEHNEMTRFGSAPTACPSGRIPWDRLIADMKEAPVAGISIERASLIGSSLLGRIWAYPLADWGLPPDDAWVCKMVIGSLEYKERLAGGIAKFEGKELIEILRADTATLTKLLRDSEGDLARYKNAIEEIDLVLAKVANP